MTESRKTRLSVLPGRATPGDATSSGSSNFSLGDWVVEPDLNRLRRDEQRVQLSPLAMDILAYLAHPPGRVVSTEELVRELWDGRVVSDNPVYKIVTKLRRALRDDADKPRYIETVRKRGYRLVAPVNSLPSGRRQDRAGFQRRRTDIAGRSVVVLPVCIIGEDSRLAEFSDGLAEELMVQLSAVDGIRVVAESIDGNEPDLAVQATARLSDSRVRITVRVMRPSDTAQLWAGAYERPVSDGVDSQVGIAREVAYAIQKSEPPGA